jgi:hypothetical protein
MKADQSNGQHDQPSNQTVSMINQEIKRSA